MYGNTSYCVSFDIRRGKKRLDKKMVFFICHFQFSFHKQWKALLFLSHADVHSKLRESVALFAWTWIFPVVCSIRKLFVHMFFLRGNSVSAIWLSNSMLNNKMKNNNFNVHFKLKLEFNKIVEKNRNTIRSSFANDLNIFNQSFCCILLLFFEITGHNKNVLLNVILWNPLGYVTLIQFFAVYFTWTYNS